MKSYNHLWEKFVSDSNISLAKKNASKGKRDRRSVKKYLEDPDFCKKVKHYVKNFKNARHKPRLIYDGIQRKKRSIIVPTFPEQVVHHMIVNVLKPIFLHGMYEHSYGSLPDKGMYAGMKQIKKWIRKGGKNCKYCLKMDIKKYFDSIPHDIFLDKLRKIIHDERFMSVMEEITAVIPTGRGIPLGFYVSQWTANWYLSDLDHYIKEKLGAKYYVRYMDDMVIFGSNKRKLHAMRFEIEKYLKESLGLELKKNWQVFLFDYQGKRKRKGRFLDFMGFRFYRDRVTMRKSIMIKATRKAKRMHNKKPTVYATRQMLSYLGWITHTDTYAMYLREIKPYVNIQQCKRRISAYDRRQKGELNDTKLEKIRKHGAAA